MNKCEKHNKDFTLCMNVKCREFNNPNIWFCLECCLKNYDIKNPSHIFEQEIGRLRYHFGSEQQFRVEFQRIQQMEESLYQNVDKMYYDIGKKMTYLRQLLDNYEIKQNVTLDKLKQQSYQSMQFIQNLNYWEINLEDFHELQNIQQRSVCNYENIIYHNLLNSLSQLADILELQVRELRMQIKDINAKIQNQLQENYEKHEQQEKKVGCDNPNLVGIRTMSMSYDEHCLISGGDSTCLNLYNIYTQSREKNPRKLNEKIQLVDFIRQPKQPQQPYQVAVLTDHISIHNIDNINLKQLEILGEGKVILKSSECNNIKIRSLQFLNEGNLLIIGEKETFIFNLKSKYNLQSEKKIIHLKKITDIDICQDKKINKILIGCESGYTYFGQFLNMEGEISESIFSQQESSNLSKQLVPITQVKISSGGKFYLTCHSQKKDPQKNNLLKIWNFQQQEIGFIESEFSYARFIGQEQLFITFTSSQYKIWNINRLDNTINLQASNIICDEKSKPKFLCPPIIQDGQIFTSIYLGLNTQLERRVEDVNLLLNQISFSNVTPLEINN